MCMHIFIVSNLTCRRIICLHSFAFRIELNYNNLFFNVIIAIAKRIIKIFSFEISDTKKNSFFFVLKKNIN